jgi:hypothetical protein
MLIQTSEVFMMEDVLLFDFLMWSFFQKNLEKLFFPVKGRARRWLKMATLVIQ